MKKKMPVISLSARLLAFLLLCVIISSCSSSKRTARSGRISKSQKKKYALIMHVPENKIRDNKLYSFIDEWWGVKYKYGGNTKMGVDCSSFVQQLYKNVYGVNIQRTTALQFENSKHVKRNKKLRQGDLVFFATNGKDKRTVSHVGFYLLENCFVHAATTGVMINSLQEAYWDQRYLCGGRPKK